MKRKKQLYQPHRLCPCGGRFCSGTGKYVEVSISGSKIWRGSLPITYVLLAVTFGFTLMITEVAMGRRTRMSCIEAFGSLNRRFAPLGWLAATIPVIIAPYYCVIGGWVVKYFVEFVRGNGMAVSSDTYFGDFISMAGSGILENPLLWFVIFVLLTAVVVLLGVDTGSGKGQQRHDAGASAAFRRDLCLLYDSPGSRRGIKVLSPSGFCGLFPRPQCWRPWASCFIPCP